MNEATQTNAEEDGPIFVVYGQDGQVWQIFEDGRISGFPTRCVILNRIPTRFARRYAEAKSAKA